MLSLGTGELVTTEDLVKHPIFQRQLANGNMFFPWCSWKTSASTEIQFLGFDYSLLRHQIAQN